MVERLFDRHNLARDPRCEKSISPCVCAPRILGQGYEQNSPVFARISNVRNGELPNVRPFRPLQKTGL
jgi:hypothetical protein